MLTKDVLGGAREIGDATRHVTWTSMNYGACCMNVGTCSMDDSMAVPRCLHVWALREYVYVCVCLSCVVTVRPLQ